MTKKVISFVAALALTATMGATAYAATCSKSVTTNVGSTCTTGTAKAANTCGTCGRKLNSSKCTTKKCANSGTTQKPSATKKPTATKKPAATQKPSATQKPASGTNMSAMAEEVVRQTNAERAKKGLSALSVSSELTNAACVRAKEIVEKFSHERPDGTKVYSISSKVKGENIAKGQQSADKVMAAWMSSSGHSANILRSSFSSIGVCAYQVNGVMYWVQLFG